MKFEYKIMKSSTVGALPKCTMRLDPKSCNSVCEMKKNKERVTLDVLSRFGLHYRQGMRICNSSNKCGSRALTTSKISDRATHISVLDPLSCYIFCMALPTISLYQSPWKLPLGLCAGLQAGIEQIKP
jgi:hypothetical protein